MVWTYCGPPASLPSRISHKYLYVYTSSTPQHNNLPPHARTPHHAQLMLPTWGREPSPLILGKQGERGKGERKGLLTFINY